MYAGGKETAMKLVMAIVRDQDATRVIDALVSHEFRTTRINTAGGFLKRGNATLLIGVDDDQVDEAISIVQGNCRPPRPDEGAQEGGRGVLFVLPVAASYRM
jgi:uncharacterized protein YaaQ